MANRSLPKVCLENPFNKALLHFTTAAEIGIENALMQTEAIARNQRDAHLSAAGWSLENFSELNLAASLGVVVYGLLSAGWPAHYVLIVDGKAMGIVETKRERVTLSEVAFVLVIFASRVEFFNQKRFGQSTHLLDRSELFRFFIAESSSLKGMINSNGFDRRGPQTLYPDQRAVHELVHYLSALRLQSAITPRMLVVAPCARRSICRRNRREFASHAPVMEFPTRQKTIGGLSLTRPNILSFCSLDHEL